jgi:hypothetical protein
VGARATCSRFMRFTSRRPASSKCMNPRLMCTTRTGCRLSNSTTRLASGCVESRRREGAKHHCPGRGERSRSRPGGGGHRPWSTAAGARRAPWVSSIRRAMRADCAGPTACPASSRCGLRCRNAGTSRPRRRRGPSWSAPRSSCI